MPKLYWKSDWVLASALSLAFLLVSGGSVLQSLERKAYDFGVSASHREVGDKIAIIAIDDESIANIGRWPWPRDIQAKMLDTLAAAKPKVIGNTIFFLEPQTDPGLGYINKIADFVADSNIANSAPQLNALILEAQTQLNTDATLAASMKAANNVVLAMPFVIGEPLGNPDAPFPAYIAKNQLTNIVGDEQDSAYLTPANAAFLPISVIAESATSVGHLNASPDIDGAIRAEPLVLNYYNQYYPSVALQIATKYLNLSASDVTLQLGESGQAGVILGRSKSAQLKIATNRALQMNTFFYANKGDQPAFPIDSFYDVLNGKISAKKYAGKIVLIGATANGVGDSFITPISTNMKPIETLAHSVASILNEDFYLSPSWAIWLELAVWLLVSAYLILFFPRLKANHAALVTFGLLLVLVVAHYLLMTQKG